MAQNNTQGFPEGDALQNQIIGRNRRGSIWRSVFLAALVLAIVVLHCSANDDRQRFIWTGCDAKCD